MKARIPKSFVALSDLYIAYRKAKAEAYFEKTHSHALAFTKYEQNITQNIENLHQHITSSDADWFSSIDFLGDQGYLPKSIDTSLWDNSNEGHFQALDPISHWGQQYSISRHSTRLNGINT